MVQATRNRRDGGGAGRHHLPYRRRAPRAWESAKASSAAGGTGAVVAALERRSAKDARAYLELGLAYQQLTRETGDAAYYPARSEL